MKQLFAILFLLILISCNNAATSTSVNEEQNSTKINDKKTNNTDKENEAVMQADGTSTPLAGISKKDSILYITNDMKVGDHRFFGYKNPDTASTKMILISTFSSDVDGDPLKLPLGAYYETGNMNGTKIKFAETNGNFIRTMVTTKKSGVPVVVFFEKKWISFDN